MGVSVQMLISALHPQRKGSLEEEENQGKPAAQVYSYKIASDKAKTIAAAIRREMEQEQAFLSNVLHTSYVGRNDADSLSNVDFAAVVVSRGAAGVLNISADISAAVSYRDNSAHLSVAQNAKIDERVLLLEHIAHH